MIKCHISKKKRRSWVKTNGTGRDLLNETAMLINSIYLGIRKENPDTAEAYKEMLLYVLQDPRGPVFVTHEEAEAALAKDNNVPGKFATDTNVGGKED